MTTVEGFVVDHPRLVEVVHERLLGLISAGDLLPDAKLHQNELAQRLGVSRTPVREALLRLEQEGLVYTIPRRGMFVRGVTPQDIDELYELRELLEPWAARLACLRASEEDRRALQQLQRDHEQAFPSFGANCDLHLRVVAPCHNQLAVQTLRAIWQRESAPRLYALYGARADIRRQMVAEHSAVVAAFVAGRAEDVERLVLDHLRHAWAATLEHAAGDGEHQAGSSPGRTGSDPAAP